MAEVSEGIFSSEVVAFSYVVDSSLVGQKILSEETMLDSYILDNSQSFYYVMQT